MKVEKSSTRYYVKGIVRVSLATGAVLAIPLVAMQLNDEVNWGIVDFITIGSLVAGAGFIFQFLVVGIKNTTHRIAATIFLLAAVLFVWAEIAVGVLGTPFSGS